MDVQDVLHPDLLKHVGIPRIAIVNYGNTTTLFVDGKRVGEGCRYVRYQHDLREGGGGITFETDHKDNPTPADTDAG